MKRAATACVFALGLMLGAATAHAGEYNGKGEPVPGGVNGNSACSFSGRDVPDADEGPRNMPMTSSPHCGTTRRTSGFT